MSIRTLLLLGSLALAGWAAAQAAAPGSSENIQIAQATSRATSVAPIGAGHLSVRGQDILDPSGNPILLRGWNWGHWGKAIEQDAADNAAQGANVVRLPVRWWGYYQGKGIESRDDSAPGGIDPEHLRILDDNVRWASRAHLWIILFIDSNCGQNGLQNATMVQYCDPKHQYPQGHNFWADRDQRAHFISLWRFIAARYKDNPYIGMFEPLPEPGNENTTPEQITQFYTEVTAAIREVAPGIPFLIGGNRYRPGNIRDAYNPAWKDVVYTGNLFGHEGDAGSGDIGALRKHFEQMLAFRQQHNVPLFVQQIGIRGNEDPDQSHLRELLGMVNQNHVGFAYWEYRGSKKAGDYGVITGAKGEFQTNQPVLNVISQSFRQR